MKKLLGKFVISAIALLFINVTSINILAQSNLDYPESLGRCFGVYKINSKIRPQSFLDFEYFYLDKLLNQDTDNPKSDSKDRFFIGGKIKLNDNTILKIKKAFVRTIKIDGDKDNYKNIYFETIEVNSLSYKFKGEFLEKMMRVEDGGYSKVRGTLTKFKMGKKIAESNLSFYEYAEL